MNFVRILKEAKATQQYEWKRKNGRKEVIPLVLYYDSYYDLYTVFWRS